VNAEWFDPSLIRFKISPHDDLWGEKDGDWDVERRHELSRAIKHRSIVQRYVEGKSWAETDLFVDNYAHRIQKESVRGASTLAELICQYETRVDGMFDDLQRNGFRADGPLPKLLLGRNGEVFIGNQGNHRLAMAHVLGLKKFAGDVICRHRQMFLTVT
jgi:hypothetical protein